jgi:hypothetical protein
VVLHLVNLADTIAEEPSMVAHTDRLTHFEKDAQGLPEIVLTVNAELPFVPTKATLCTPERDEEISLPIVQKDGALCVNVPADTFAGYAFIAIET